MASERDDKAREAHEARGSGAREPQPWHAADEQRRRGRGAPVGTHSLTGGGGDVGMPARPTAERGVERSEPRDAPKEQWPDPMAEPRADLGEILGRKP